MGTKIKGVKEMRQLLPDNKYKITAYREVDRKIVFFGYGITIKMREEIIPNPFEGLEVEVKGNTVSAGTQVGNLSDYVDIIFFMTGKTKDGTILIFHPVNVIDHWN